MRRYCNKYYRFFILSLVFLLAACNQPEPAGQNELSTPASADLILHNSFIYTQDASRSWAQAIAIKDGVIVAVGSNQKMKAFSGEGTETVDLQGRMVMPGMIDSHIHAIGPGLDQFRCILPGTFENPTEADMVAAIKACDKRFHDDPILFGHRFTTSAIPMKEMTRQYLDAIVGDRPVVLQDESGHNKWLNSKALALTEIDNVTPNPEGGVIVRDENGEATGFLQSSAAKYIRHLEEPELSSEQYFQGLTWSMKEMARLGVTAGMDAIVRIDTLPLWQSVLSQEGLVAPRMNLCHWVGDNFRFEPPAAKDLVAAWDAQNFPEDVRACAKIYGDNVLEAGTAGMLENYANRDHPGRMNWTAEEFDAVIRDLDAHDLPIKVHSIGDKTTRTLLDVFTEVLAERGNNDIRHHIAHLTSVHPDDWARFRELDIPGEFIGAVSALIPYVKTAYYDSVGHERFHKQHHPAGGILRAGGIVNASSDWGAGILDPMRSIQTVITRKDPNNPEIPAAAPEHALDLPEAIAVHTINGAYVLGRDQQTGSLEVGKQADLIVLDRNLFEVPVEEIRDTQVLWTLIGGREAWRHEQF